MPFRVSSNIHPNEGSFDTMIQQLSAKISHSSFLHAVIAIALGVACMTGSAAYADASEPELISTHYDWSAYTFEENGNKVCYMASIPRKAQGDYTKRGEIYALITHRPAEDTKDVFSYITGYDYKENSDVTVKIGSKEFTLFTQDDTAWAPDSETDSELAEAIKKGSTMIVKGVSTRGTKTTDTFSLKGSSAAYKAISKKCDM